MKLDKFQKNNHRDSASLKTIADTLVKAAKRIMRSSKTEEDLKVKFERILGPLIESAGIVFDEKYERGSQKAKTVLKGKRPDAIHGQVVVEYEAPEAFKYERNIEHAYKQLMDYVSAEAEGITAGGLEGLIGILGVGFDGSSIFFVHCKWEAKTIHKSKHLQFAKDGPYFFNSESALTFVTYLRSLSRVPLTAENLADRFGPKSSVAREAIGAFADALENWNTPRIKIFYQEWIRLFGIIYGEQHSTGTDKKTKALSEIYDLPKESDFQSTLFCVHTYFALLMKLIAAELLSISEGTFTSSFSTSLVHNSDKELLANLLEIEDGGIYHKRGITNFLEGDFFRWYLESFASPRLRDAVRNIARTLSEFEPATTAIEPEVARDLLKKLYQYLVPEVVRHHLGEYYTPDWLAELVLNESGFRGDTRKRVLDPACGSGTFIVLAIQKMRNFAVKNKEPAIETIKRILANVWGFDFNPLAVIAARTNYLFALGNLSSELGEFEIPVYLADSVLWPKKRGQMLLSGDGVVEVPTSVGTFQVPKIWVDDPTMMRRAAIIVEELANTGCNKEQAMERFKKEGVVFPPHYKAVERFFEHILELEKGGRNGIWARFLKNVFAPVIAGKFDYVIGNPPWIRWSYLSNEYRQATLEMWQDYGLFSLKGHASRLGGGEKDFSMLFTYAAADHYLSVHGKLGFLITQEVFKSKGAGEGFRKFRFGQGDTFRVIKAHDLSQVQPFEGAANKTAAIFLSKSGHTTYPLPYIVWKRKTGIGKIPTNLKLKEAKKLLRKESLLANPIGKSNGSWQTTSANDQDLKHIRGDNAYKARRGASTEPYGVFWLEVKEILSNQDLIVRNLVEKGKRKIQKIEERIENDLIYPAVRGSDIERWGTKSKVFVLLVQDPEKSEPYSEKIMRERWPHTYNYLTRFRDVLLSRGSRTVRELAERTAFYAMYGIGKYTVARYKVVWKRMASDLIASVISQTKTEFGWKTLIPTDTTSLIATDTEEEAHYICAVLNSMSVGRFVKSYSAAGRGFGSPSVMEHIGIPKFDNTNKLHKKISELSITLHRLKTKEEKLKVQKLEGDVEKAVRELFGLG